MFGGDAMKKKVIIFISILAIIGIFIAVKVQQNSSRSDLEKALGVDFKKVDKVTISCGTTGKKSDIVGKEKIEVFIKNFDGAKLTKDQDQERRAGFILSVTLYKSNKDIGGFSFGYNKMIVYKGDNFTRYTSSINIDDDKIENMRLKYGLTK